MSEKPYATRYEGGDIGIWREFDEMTKWRSDDILEKRDTLWHDARRYGSGLIVVASTPEAAEQYQKQWLKNRQVELNSMMLEHDIASPQSPTDETMYDRALKEAQRDLEREIEFQFELTTMMARMQFAFERDPTLRRTEMAWLNWAFQTTRHDRNDGHILRGFYSNKLDCAPIGGYSGYNEYKRQAESFIAAHPDAEDILGLSGD